MATPEMVRGAKFVNAVLVENVPSPTMLRCIALVLAVISGALPAVAQDRWTGVYGGLSIGTRTLESVWETTCLGSGFPGSICPDASGIYPDRLANSNPAHLRDRDAYFSGFLGAQLQQGKLVFGIEGDFGYADQSKSHGGIPGAEDPLEPGSTRFDSARVTAGWDASLRGRAGFLITPSAMLYATGGISWLELEASAYCGAEFPLGWCSLDNVGRRDTTREIVQGWTFGGGFEVLMTSNILVRGEFRRSEYEDIQDRHFDGNLRNADALDFEVESATKTFTLGIGYKF